MSQLLMPERGFICRQCLLLSFSASQFEMAALLPSCPKFDESCSDSGFCQG
ncbi:MAG: hypothetical protein Q4B94_08225 [Pseudomonadota bacterium]|nr:hypothetical protein [Pseudomonadota bacterium]